MEDQQQHEHHQKYIQGGTRVLSNSDIGVDEHQCHSIKLSTLPHRIEYLNDSDLTTLLSAGVK